VRTFKGEVPVHTFHHSMVIVSKLKDGIRIVLTPLHDLGARIGGKPQKSTNLLPNSRGMTNFSSPASSRLRDLLNQPQWRQQEHRRARSYLLEVTPLDRDEKSCWILILQSAFLSAMGHQCVSPSENGLRPGGIFRPWLINICNLRRYSGCFGTHYVREKKIHFFQGSTGVI